MWDYYYSRLIEMAQVFLGMDFIQAFNPLYALPIVAVILGAFLVYAFGFKAPVQPPSFDEIEVDKKSSKRKKVKENQKNKSQVNKTSSNTKPVENLVVDKKKREKADKSVTEKNTSKDDIKVVKKSASTTDKKKVNTGRQEQSLILEDDSDEGWVHLVPKKGRKGRKKDDLSANSETMSSAIIQAEVLDLCDKPLQTQIKADILDEKKKTNDSGDNAVKMPPKTLHKEQVIKENTNKKQKSKKKDKENIEVAANPNSTLDQEPINELKNPVMSDINSSDVANSAGMKVSKEKKPSKKKKKKYEADEKENIQTTEASAVSYSPCASENIAGLPDDISDIKVDKVVEGEVTTGGKKMSVAEKTEKQITSNIPEQPIEPKGLNVAFDELEGLYPDAKPAKKKKKARRDH